MASGYTGLANFLHYLCRNAWSFARSQWVRELESQREEICWRGRLGADYTENGINNDLFKTKTFINCWMQLECWIWSCSWLHGMNSIKGVSCCVIITMYCSGSVVAVLQICGGSQGGWWRVADVGSWGSWQYRVTVEEIMRIMLQQSGCVWQNVSCQEDSVSSAWQVSAARTMESAIVRTELQIVIVWLC